MTNYMKVYITNLFTFILSFSSCDEILKISLLVLSIIFTVQRIYINSVEYKEKHPKNKNK